MGRSAKFHKRQQKKTASSAGSTTAASSSQPAPRPKTVVAGATPAEQKKHAGLKAKARASAQKREGDGPVLGGADYVELMFGGRRRAKAEAAKLPKDPEP